jgi:hypothetical protein
VSQLLESSLHPLLLAALQLQAAQFAVLPLYKALGLTELARQLLASPRLVLQSVFQTLVGSNQVRHLLL